MPAPSRTRFAPAPTGLLHLGHVVNAIYVWGWARARGADVLLRIEDHDRQRARPEYEQAILDDLDWLGFAPDHYPTSTFRRGVCASRQRDRDAIYQSAAAALAARDLVYGCRCSRQALAAAPTAGVYPGTCRDLGIAPGDGVTWRVRLDDTIESFDDGMQGAQVQRPLREHGDPAIRDRHGNWTYHFAVTVDDQLQGIDWVIRGVDLLSATGLQIALGRQIGRTSPARFWHHPLVMKTATQKLSKSDGDTGIRHLREAGWSAGRVIGTAAALMNLVPHHTDVTAADLPHVIFIAP